MLINFFARSFVFALFILGIFWSLIFIGFHNVPNISKLFLPISAYLLGSFLYTLYYKDRFSSLFIINTLVFNFILMSISIVVQGGSALLSQTDWFLSTLIILGIFVSCLIFLYPFCRIGNLIALKYLTQKESVSLWYNKPIFSLDRPFAFALPCTIIFLIISSLLYKLSKEHHAAQKMNILLSFFLLLLVFAILSFVYTYFYQKKMTRKFKIIAISQMILFFPIIIIILAILNPAKRSFVLGLVNNIQGLIAISFIINLVSLSNFILLFIIYLLITIGNILALKFINKIKSSNEKAAH